MSYTIITNLKKIVISPVVTLVFIALALTANGQDAKGYIKFTEPPPVMLKGGNLVDLFAIFRENQGSLIFELESKSKIVPVVFQTVVKHNGELIGRSRRKPMPYFPGEMMMCPESFDFISLLFQKADKNGTLPAGKYQVGLSVLNGEGRPIGKESQFTFAVP